LVFLLRWSVPAELAKFFRNSFDVRATPATVSAPRNGTAAQSGKTREEISEFPLATIEMIATVAGPVGSGAFEKVAQILQKSR
jgi:hypothetical protein